MNGTGKHCILLRHWQSNNFEKKKNSKTYSIITSVSFTQVLVLQNSTMYSMTVHKVYYLHPQSYEPPSTVKLSSSTNVLLSTNLINIYLKSFHIFPTHQLQSKTSKKDNLFFCLVLEGVIHLHGIFLSLHVYLDRFHGSEILTASDNSKLCTL